MISKVAKSTLSVAALVLRAARGGAPQTADLCVGKIGRGTLSGGAGAAWTVAESPQQITTAYWRGGTLANFQASVQGAAGLILSGTCGSAGTFASVAAVNQPDTAASAPQAYAP